MNNELKNSGFQPPIYDPADFVLGSDLALPAVPINHNGDWTAFLPSEERQNILFETYNCVSFSLLNCMETMFKFFYGEIDNFSDRFLGIMAGTTTGGNDPTTVAQAARHNGLIPETLLPYDYVSNMQEYYSFKSADKDKCISKGQEFLQKWYLGFENVPVNLTKMREALQYSPLQISVCAWFENDKGQYYSPEGMSNNHATCLYKIDDIGQFYIFDSYPPFLKILTPDHNIQFAKRYHIGLVQENLKQQISLLQQVLLLLKNLYAKIYSVGSEILAGIFTPRQSD